MPVIIEPGPGPCDGMPDTYARSQCYSNVAFQKMMVNNPELIPECDQTLPDIIMYHRESNNVRNTEFGRVSCYMFNKIRIILGIIQKRHGYPAVRHHTVAFFDLLMFHVPFYTKTLIKQTIEFWDQPVEWPRFSGNWSKIRDYQWRAVRIVDIPDEYQSMIMNAIPFNIDETLISALLLLTARRYLLYPNIVDRSGLHDKIIICNWDYILQELNENGY